MIQLGAFRFDPVKFRPKPPSIIGSYDCDRTSSFDGYGAESGNGTVCSTGSSYLRSNTKSHRVSNRKVENVAAKAGIQEEVCRIHGDVRRQAKDCQRKDTNSSHMRKHRHEKRILKVPATAPPKPISVDTSPTPPLKSSHSTKEVSRKGLGQRTISAPCVSQSKVRKNDQDPLPSSACTNGFTALKKEIPFFHKTESGKTQANASEYRKHVNKQKCRSAVGRCEAVEILDRSIDSLKVTEENLLDPLDERHDTKLNTSNGDSSKRIGHIPDHNKHLSMRTKELKTFTFQSLTRPQEVVRSGMSLSGLLADQKFNTMKSLLQSRGNQYKTSAPAPISPHRRMVNKSDSNVASVFRTQKQELHRANTWVGSVDSVWSKDDQRLPSPDKKPSRASDGTERPLNDHMLSKNGAMPLKTSIGLQHDSAIENNGILPGTISQTLNVSETGDKVYKEFKTGRKDPRGVSVAVGFKSLQSASKPSLRANNSYSLQEKVPTWEKASSNVDSRNFDILKEGKYRTNKKESNFKQDVNQGKPKGHSMSAGGNTIDSGISSGKDMNGKSNYMFAERSYAKSQETKSLYKSKSAKGDRYIKKGDSNSGFGDSPPGRPDYERAQTAVCMGTSSFEPINRRYATHSSQSQRNKVMFTAQDYVGYQHRKFSKEIKIEETPEKYYTNRTKAEFIHVNIGQKPDSTF